MVVLWVRRFVGKPLEGKDAELAILVLGLSQSLEQGMDTGFHGCKDLGRTAPLLMSIVVFTVVALISSVRSARTSARPPGSAALVVRLVLILVFVVLVVVVLIRFILVGLRRRRVIHLGELSKVGELRFLRHNGTVLDQFLQLVFEYLAQLNCLLEDGGRRSIIDLGVMGNQSNVAHKLGEGRVLFPEEFALALSVSLAEADGRVQCRQRTRTVLKAVGSLITSK